MTDFTYEQALESSTQYFNGDTLAAKVFVDKYALKDNDGKIYEDAPEKMHRRLAKEFARIEKNKFNKPLSEEEIFGYFDKFRYIVPQGSPMSAIGNDYQIQSLGSCFVIPDVVDSYGGICYADQQLAQLMKRRAGVGTCLDNIRPKGVVTHNAAKTTDGIGVFMERFSTTCREVAQGGRRGALMLILSIHHPEIETFINIKKDLKKVTGANISVKITDEFMDAVKNNVEYEQRWPINSKTPKIVKKVNAKAIWDQIIDSAWQSAEPGILFFDNIKKYGTSDIYKSIDKRFEDIATNPCIPAYAKLLTPDGVKELKDINIGDKIWSETGWTNIINKWSTGIKEVYKFYTDGFSEILGENPYFIGTENHKIVSNGVKIEIGKADSVDCFHDDGPDGESKIEDVTKDRYNCSITNVEYVAKEEVFDITVDNETHTFWCNGLNISNCGEIPMGVDSCRLMVVNLFGYIKNPFSKNSSFDYELFYEHTKIAQRLMDDMIDLEIEAIDKIIQKINKDPEEDHIKRTELETWKSFRETCIAGRRTGLGITALGDILAALGIKYGSDKSIDVTEEIYKQLCLASMESSCEMAKELGSFPVWNKEIEKNHPFLERVFEASPKIKKLHNQYGRRNISLTTTAPTGTVSICTQTTSGIEPPYLLSYIRRRKINPDSKNIKVDFVDHLGDKWEENTVYHHHLKTWMDITGEKDIEKSPYFGATSNDVNWIKSVEIQAVAQKWITHSISKTCNIPNSATKDLISDIYLKAWETGCKGFTVYRDGCRSGVLVSESPKQNINKIIHTKAPKRPESLVCDIHHLILNDKRYYAVIGLLEGDPYEVFVGLNTDDEKDPIVPKSIKNGKLTKKARQKYVLTNEDKEFSVVISNGHTDENADALGRLLSTALRHGTPIDFIVHQLEKTHGSLTSFSKIISRVLKKYIKDGAIVHGENCKECGSQLQRSDGCVNCKSCGWTKCS